MVAPEAIRRGGDEYNRLAEPAWADPLDTSYSRRFGGRWNAPGRFGVLYLNRGRRMARLQVNHKLAGQPYGVEDLDPDEQHDLVELEVNELDWRDCVTNSGLTVVGLPATYPVDAAGNEVPRSTCQPIGQAAYDDGLPGIACRSAATGAGPDDEELAVFDTHRHDVRQTNRVAFDEWYWGS